MKSVIIFGMGPTRNQCLFDTETWGLNTTHIVIYNMQGRLDKLFFVHAAYDYPTYLDREGLRVNPIFWNWSLIDGLAKMGVDVISLHKIKGVQARLYPLKRIMKKFDTDFFTDTVCYMLAYAIDKGYEEIKMYGIDMADKQEYRFEKGGIEYWIGFARARGIKVWIAPGSNVCRTITGKPIGTPRYERIRIWQETQQEKNSQRKQALSCVRQR